MKVIISGYGRMGKMVEEVCRQRGHEVAAIIDNPSGWETTTLPLQDSMVIDFSMPEVAVNNILHCFRLGIPVVTGTTGWYDKLESVKKACANTSGTLFYAPNFSLGVNILFHVNRVLAKIMASAEGYRVSVSETHHIHKLDAPSGTALRLAEDILRENPQLKTWKNTFDENPEVLPVISYREGEVPGIHEVVYNSEADILTLKHEAKNRKGFALGAVLAAEFLSGKKGVFTMNDFLKSMGM
jgi:4-hydroxy-tetrahydrodipicolinate reductase